MQILALNVMLLDHLDLVSLMLVKIVDAKMDIMKTLIMIVKTVNNVNILVLLVMEIQLSVIVIIYLINKIIFVKLFIGCKSSNFR